MHRHSQCICVYINTRTRKVHDRVPASCTVVFIYFVFVSPLPRKHYRSVTVCSVRPSKNRNDSLYQNRLIIFCLLPLRFLFHSTARLCAYTYKKMRFSSFVVFFFFVIVLKNIKFEIWPRPRRSFRFGGFVAGPCNNRRGPYVYTYNRRFVIFFSSSATIKK